MAKFFKLLVVIPVALVGLAFAVANRHLVTVSFDPFAGTDISSPQITAPLFFVLFLALMLGVVVGGIAAWLAQGKKRRQAREAKAEAEKWRVEADRFKAQFGSVDQRVLTHHDPR
jgi:uncharacterized integral membrane protein